MTDIDADAIKRRIWQEKVESRLAALEFGRVEARPNGSSLSHDLSKADRQEIVDLRAEVTELRGTVVELTGRLSELAVGFPTLAVQPQPVSSQGSPGG